MRANAPAIALDAPEIAAAAMEAITKNNHGTNPSISPNMCKSGSPVGEPLLLYKENHALDAWFKEAYGDE